MYTDECDSMASANTQLTDNRTEINELKAKKV